MADPIVPGPIAAPAAAIDLDKCLRDKVSVVISACDNAAKQYADYYTSFAAMDTKAQATAAISGLVLAALAAFIKDGRVPVLVQAGQWWILLVLAPAAASLTSVIMALFGARVTEVVMPFDAKEQIQEAKDLADVPCDEFTQEHVLDYYRVRLDHWVAALGSIDTAPESKSYWILRSQIVLICAIFALLVLYMAVLAWS